MITVGVPTYNRALHLQEALSAILAQTFEDIEVIVCDDGSTDRTSEVVRAVHDDRITYLRSPVNLGIPGVLNRILEVAQGEAVVMLHDHDRFAPNLLQGMVEVLSSHRGVGFVNPGLAWEDEDGGRYEVMPMLSGSVIPGTSVVEQMLLGPSFSCPITACALVRRTAYDAVGFRYDPQFGFLSDVDMWLRLAARFDVGQVQAVGLVCRRRAEGHPMSDAGWELGRLAVAIHSANVERYFAGRPDELTHARRVLRRKSARLYARMMASAALCNDSGRLHQGLTVVGDDLGGFSASAARAVLRAPAIEAAIVHAGGWAGDVRRRMRRSAGRVPM